MIFTSETSQKFVVNTMNACYAVLVLCVVIRIAVSNPVVSSGNVSKDDVICCEHEENACEYSCLNQTDPGIESCNNSLPCLNTTLQCQQQDGETTKECKCLARHLRMSPDKCKSKTIRVSSTREYYFEVFSTSSIAESREKCPNSEFPKAIISCLYDESCGEGPYRGRYRLMTSTLRIFDCEKKITSLVKNVLNNETSKVDIDYLSGHLLNFTLTKASLTSEERSSVVAFVAYVRINAENKNVQVSENAFTNIALLANDLVSRAWANATYDTDEQNASHDTVAKQHVEQQELAYSLSKLAQRFKLKNASLFRLFSESLDLQVSENTDVSSAVTFENNANGTNTHEHIRVIVPGSVLQQAALLSSGQQRQSRSWQSVRSSFIYYYDDTLFYSDQDHVDSVMSIDVGVDLELNNLTEPVRIQRLDELLKYGKTPVTENTLKSLRTLSRCVYWDQNFRRWSSEGCCLHISDTGAPECRCHHLTNFAVIVKSDVVASDIALSLVSDVGCILSMVGLLLTVIVHLIDREIRQRRPVKIVIHICCNLFITYLIFVVAIGQTSNMYGCLLATALLHYFLLTSWCWMNVYSYDMYKSLVKVFDERPRRFLQLCMLYAYGLPLAIVIITAGIAIGYFDQQRVSGLCTPGDDLLLESYYRAPNMCWLHKYSLYFGFLAPIGIMLVYNCVVFCRVTYELSCNNSQARSRELRRTAKQNLIIAVTMTSMLGLTWASGYIVLISDDQLFETITSWLFAVLCTLQGFAIFILTSVRRSDMRKVWLSPLRSMARRTSIITGSGIFRSAPRKQSTSSAACGNGAGDLTLMHGKKR